MIAGYLGCREDDSGSVRDDNQVERRLMSGSWCGAGCWWATRGPGGVVLMV